MECFDEDGKPSKDSCLIEKLPEAPYDVMKFLSENIEYPMKARYNDVSGRVSVMFVVDKNGRIKNIQSIGQKLGAGCDEEAIRVVSLMPPWKPGRAHNKRVNFVYTLPISFRLE